MLTAGLLGVVVVTAVLLQRAPAVEEVAVRVTVAADADAPDRTVELDARLYLPATTPAPAILLAHGFGSNRTAMAAVARGWAQRGYVALAWSARGFGASGGQIPLADPDVLVADVSALVDLLADRDEVAQDGRRDPRVGIAGGSYGGGTALLAAAAEDRLDAVVAVAPWHDLADALAPNAAGDDLPGVLKAQWASLLFAAGGLDRALADLEGTADGGLDGLGSDQGGSPTALLCGRFTTDVCEAYLASAADGVLTAEAVELLHRSSLAGRLGDLTAPTLLVAGLDDTLFPLGASLSIAEALLAAPAPVALRWVDTGHTGLGDRGTPSGDLAEEWMATWLPPDPIVDVSPPDLPVFGWVDRTSGRTVPGDALPTTFTPVQAGGTGEPVDGALVLRASGRRLVADGAPSGLLPVGDDGVAAAPRRLPLVHPAGGLPASISTLPGLGGLGDLLPSLDVPGQGVALTTDAFGQDAVLLGTPRLTLRVTPTLGAEVLLFVKLLDVAPGGSTTLLQSTVNPARFSGGTTTVTLQPVAHRLVAGNRLRLVVSTTDQAFADGDAPATYELDLSGTPPELVLPVSSAALPNTLPAAVGLLLPVALVGLAAAGVMGAVRRRERAMATGAADVDVPPVRIEGLVKRYADGKVAVDGLDLQVERGQVFGLLGPNGAGKTTTMRMLLGLARPTSGRIRLLGNDLVPGHPVLARVGVLVEGPGFAPYLTGRQNLEGWWLAGGRPLAEADLDRALAVADLGAAIDRPVRTYSHGMRQRLAIAQALLGRPELLVLDEPTDGLDPEQIRGMRRLLARLGQEGTTVLVSSHLLAEVEQMCTHVAVIQHGRVRAVGPVAELLGADRSIVVQVDDRDRARQVLAGVLDPADVAVEGAGVAVHLGGRDPADVVEALVAAGVRVRSVAPRGRLEDLFLELTGGTP